MDDRATPDPGSAMRWFGLLLLLGIAAPHAAGALFDAALAIRFPYEIAYGEGVVWEQAALMGGPRAYSADVGLPFVVFHYPPVYHLLVRAVGTLAPDLLAAGRIVSAFAMVVFAGTIGAIVWAATPGGTRGLRLGAAIAAGLLAMAVPNIRAVGLLMRVDMVANALGPLALLVAFTGRPGLWRTVGALTLATLAVFTKQTELAAGLSIFGLLAWSRSRETVMAAGLVGAAGAGVVAILQQTTGGGFMTHLITYNLNRYDWAGWASRILVETTNLPLVLAILGAGLMGVGRRGGGLGPDRTPLARAVLVYFAVSLLTIAGLGKSGASFNYLNGLYGAGVMVLGIGLVQLLSGRGREIAVGTGLAAIVAGWLALQPIARLSQFLDTQDPVQQALLVQAIADADRPVLSDDMVLTIRAGKRVLVESAIVTELAVTGRWDERPLIELIREGGVAFVISEGRDLGDARRSPGVLAALNTAFPRVTQVTGRHWLHRPAIDP